MDCDLVEYGTPEYEMVGGLLIVRNDSTFSIRP